MFNQSFRRSLLAVSLVGSSLLPSSGRADDLANIHQGNVLTGMNASLSEDWFGGGNSSTYFSLSAPIQYFVIDHLAVGGLVGFSDFWGPNFPSQTSLSAGPAATYYFLVQEKVGYFVSEGVLFSHSSYGLPFTNNFWTSQTQLGMNYFLTPSVAFGPALQYRHEFASETSSAINQLSLAFAFSIYL